MKIWQILSRTPYCDEDNDNGNGNDDDIFNKDFNDDGDDDDDDGGEDDAGGSDGDDDDGRGDEGSRRGRRRMLQSWAAAVKDDFCGGVSQGSLEDASHGNARESSRPQVAEVRGGGLVLRSLRISQN